MYSHDELIKYIYQLEDLITEDTIEQYIANIVSDIAVDDFMIKVDPEGGFFQVVYSDVALKDTFKSMIRNFYKYIVKPYDYFIQQSSQGKRYLFSIPASVVVNVHNRLLEVSPEVRRVWVLMTPWLEYYMSIIESTILKLLELDYLASALNFTHNDLGRLMIASSSNLGELYTKLIAKYGSEGVRISSTEFMHQICISSQEFQDRLLHDIIDDAKPMIINISDRLPKGLAPIAERKDE